MNTQLLRAGIPALLVAALSQGHSLDRIPDAASPQAESPAPAWDLLWAGTWKKGGNLTNRADLKLGFAGPGLTLRAELLDRRPGTFETLFRRLPWEAEDAQTRFLGALYHEPTGSRILYGPLEEWGLAARLRSPWSRALPFAESRKASAADLRTSPSGKEPELYLYLGTPFFELAGSGPGLRGFVSARLDPARIAAGGELPQPPLGEGTALTAALEGRLGTAASLSLEGFYTAASIPARESSGWFSETPPLPPQKFSLYGLGALFKTAHFSLSGDLGWSRTSILGQDLYASLGFRIGGSGKRQSWQLSLAADGAGRNYTGSDGAGAGAGFRAGGKFEWKHSRAGLFRINTAVSGPGFSRNGDSGLRFDRSSSGLYYRPPAASLPLRLSRVSLGVDRDARDAVKDSVALGLSFTANLRGLVAGISGGAADGLLTLNFSGSLAGSPAGDWADADRELPPWPVPGGPYRFESAKAGGELAWSKPLDQGAGGRKTLRLAAGLDYAVSAPDAEGEIETSRNFDLRAALSGGRSRFSVSLGCAAFPWEDASSPWELGLSWSLSK
jgi:hypothetical protein